MAGSDDVETLPPGGVATRIAQRTMPGAPDTTLPGVDGSQPIPTAERLPGRGDQIAKFVVDRKLGAGAMGVVLLAVDPELDRKVAIKLLSTPDHGDRAQLRLLREAQSAARIQHPNVIAIHEVGTHEGQVYLVMEYVDGGSLRDWQTQARSTEEVLATYRQAGAGLAAAHDAGLVHRDLKPDNVLIGGDGRVRVCDFGLVGITSAPTQAQIEITSSSLGDSLTQTGAMMGTPAYMSPEQLSAGPLDARSDQFSFCVALYEALYGQRPFVGETLPNLVAAVMSQPPARPPTSDVPRHVEAAVLRGLAREPDERHRDMHDLVAKLAPTPPRTRAWLPWVGAAAIVGAGATAMFVFDDEAPGDAFTCPPASVALESTWDEATRDEVGAALRRASPARGAATFTVVDAQLSAYRDEWTQQWSQACTARSDGDNTDAEYVLRRACLHAARDDLRALATWLSKAPGWTVDGLYDLPHTLPDVAACADPVALNARAEDTTGVAPAHRDALWRAQAAYDAGKYDRARAELDELLPALRSGGDDETIANAALLRGKVSVPLREAEATEQHLHEAIQRAAAAHDVRTEAIANSVLVEWLAHQPSRVPEARGIVAGAGATARRSGSKVALAWARLASAAVEAEPAAALAAIDEALESLLALDPAPAELLRRAHARRSVFVLQIHGLDAALADHERARQTARSRMGAEHPALGHTSQSFSEALYAADEMAASRDHAVAAYEAYRTALGPRDRLTLGAQTSIARALMTMPGELEAARVTLDEALTEYDASELDEPMLETAIVENLAWLETATQRPQEAIAHYERAVQLLPRVGGDALLRLPTVEQSIGWTYWRLENMPKAREHFGRARDHVVELMGPKTLHAVLHTASIGDTYKKEGDCTAARAEYRRGLRVGADAGMAPGALMARLLVSMGECELADGDVTTAGDTLQRAYDLRDVEGLTADWQAPIDFAYGKLRAAQGGRAEAIELAQRALVTYRALPVQYDAEMNEIVEWLRARGVEPAAAEDTSEQPTPAQ